MCDTAVWVTAAGVFFAKNSDRDANEAQLLDWQRAREHPARALLRCTYLTLPQVRRTHAVLLSRPYWGWGAEIAANEHGVMVGNEAVFTTTRVPTVGLTGMDLVRLAVERGGSAEEAVSVLRALVASHPQGGSCGHENPSFRYFSSFLVADRKTAYVVETCGHESVQHQVPLGGGYAISNGLSLPSLADRHSDRLVTWASRCPIRRGRTMSHLARLPAMTADAGHEVSSVTLRALMAMLRDHGESDLAEQPLPGDPVARSQRMTTQPIRYDPLTGGLSAPCVHAGGLLAASQTTASWVAQLGGPDGDRHFVTATAAPCTGLFKPVSVTQALPQATLGSLPSDGVETVGPPSLFWQHERLHRAVLRDPVRLLALYKDERDALEEAWLRQAPAPESAFAEGWRRLFDWTGRVERFLAEHEQRHGRRHSTLPAWVERYLRIRSQRAGLLPGPRRSHRRPFRDSKIE